MPAVGWRVRSGAGAPRRARKTRGARRAAPNAARGPPLARYGVGGAARCAYARCAAALPRTFLLTQRSGFASAAPRRPQASARAVGDLWTLYSHLYVVSGGDLGG